MTTHLVWIRNDLRINDNLALYAACRDSRVRVLALFIATPGQWQQHDMASKQASFIWKNLHVLQNRLAECGIALHYLQRDNFSEAVKGLCDFCQQYKVDRVFYNYQYEVNERERDALAEKLLHKLNIICQGFDDSVLLAPGSIRTGDKVMYKVFTPFSKACIRRLRQELPQCVPAPGMCKNASLRTLPSLLPFDYSVEDFDEKVFPPGEKAALDRLRQFSQQAVVDYATQRDFPAVQGSSMLSAYLTTGVLSPRQCLQQILKEHPDALDEGSKAFIWVGELLWREFYRHLLVAWPALCQHQPFISWTRHIRWQRSQQLLNAWQEGKTGYPIVDAAMRQLNQLGWMHNRLRMVSASFLVKDLLIDWREGERYFMSRLIDGDLAANNGGWQWAASSGTDAVPYFRIFNPTTQGKRFDSDGAFIRQWLPELDKVPDSAIHHPHSWAEKNNRRLDYPLPVVDHKEARKNTLAEFERARRMR